MEVFTPFLSRLLFFFTFLTSPLLVDNGSEDEWDGEVNSPPGAPCFNIFGYVLTHLCLIFPFFLRNPHKDRRSWYVAYALLLTLLITLECFN